MGRWMQVLKQPAEARRETDAQVIGEVAPHPLMHAFGSLCQANPGKRDLVQWQFPMLSAVSIGSQRYADETLELRPDETRRLLDEVERLRRVCGREEYIESLDGPASYAAWRGTENAEEFEGHLDDIVALLRRAVASGHTVRLML